MHLHIPDDSAEDLQNQTYQNHHPIVGQHSDGPGTIYLSGSLWSSPKIWKSAKVETLNALMPLFQPGRVGSDLMFISYMTLGSQLLKEEC